MQKNYYLILGVSPAASGAEIKAAFRRRAHELHPDHSGLESGPFLEIQEAYGVLSDPTRRRHYDLQSQPTEAPRRVSRSEPMTADRRRPESFRPVAPATGFREYSIAESFAAFRPSDAELFDRLPGNFEAARRPKSEHLESLTVEIVISPAAARRGGRVRLKVPARVRCSVCSGAGSIESYACYRCAGSGSMTSEIPMNLEYPPGIRDGYALHVPLTRLGIHNFYLSALLRVSSVQGI